jgi:hypothetical protein
MGMEVTNNQTRSLVILDPVYQDELITFAGAGTLLAGTILARRAVATAVVAAADVGNTGDGTVTLATVAAGQVIPMVGAYVLECTEAVTNGGVFKLVDPNGAIVATGLAITVGAGAATILEVAGLQFTVTDGATDFIVGDKFTLTVAADGKMVAFATNGAGGVQIPKAVLQDALTATGAGDLACRPLIGGRVRAGDLVIDADGDASNIDAAITDQLRDFTIVPQETTQLGEADNQ